MLPLQQAREVRDSVIEYIKATFRFKEKNVGDAFYRFIEDEQDGLFKGPYISLKTPFVSATPEESVNIPLDIAPSFPPYKHQLQAFKQLTMKDGHKPEPTLLTTGTGSGKTECFLYPILDYCYHCNRFEHQPGVKVIIMYPMNALASDQAKRIAEVIWSDERLRGKVTAGLFVGEGIDAKEYPRDMGADHIIENRDAILDTVPDILLTNFKMLDYGLMRQRFMSLWKGNIDTELKALRFIVLDELHTYDGAQGTDVANLIRRLKLKLSLPKNYLCPVGTSATIGNGDDSKKRLCEYATNVFGEQFKEENIIEEHRIPVDQYVEPSCVGLPDGKMLRECVFRNDDTVTSYLRRLCKIWLKKSDITAVEAGVHLRKLGIVGDLLKTLEDGVRTLKEIQNRLEDNADFRRLRQQYSEKTCLIAVENLLALIAYAKRALPNGKPVPMLYLQVQLWQRELSGILRYVQKEPEFIWRGSLKNDDDRIALPMYFCRDCGASGWLSRRLATDDRFCSDIKSVNTAFMNNEKEVVLLNVESDKHHAIPEYVTDNAIDSCRYVKLKDLSDANNSDDGTIRLHICSKTGSNRNGNQKFANTCPECNGGNTICEIGGRTSTLSSVAVSQVLSSDFDNAKVSERKILVFCNSVQDAAYQAGFYEARTFRFLFRQSMQKYINTLDEPINLVELEKGFKEFWHERLPEEEYYHRFLPSDLASHIDLNSNYRDDGGKGFMEKFKREFEIRVDWEITSEFGLTAQLGRTLEKTGSSASFFKREEIEDVYQKMVDWMNENNMERIVGQEESFCHFVHGILQRMRIHGAIDHPYLSKYREEALTKWALNWKLDGRHFLNRELGSSMHFPKLVGAYFTEKNADMLDMAVLRREGKDNWYSAYFFKYFNDIGISNNMGLFNDFMRKLLDTMVEAGLLNKREQGGGNYAICPEHIWISKKVKHIKCDLCQSRLCVAENDEMAEGTKCLDFKCHGIYSEESKPELNYYQQVYNRNKSPRVHANEHTGLLERYDREELEKDFKQHPTPDSTNVLVATSTLEMGIDIGDLNVTGNTNVPPKPSNFLQRVGRAGRKEGSALVLNYAHSNEPHDMYYFTYPKEMMQGEVTPPGCFLEAKDILRRHFLAYCIDCWTSADRANTLPSRISELKLTTGDVFSNADFILNKLISFIKGNKATLQSQFRSVYEASTQTALNGLFETLRDETFYNHIVNVFGILQERLLHLGEELEQYKEQKLHIQPNDPLLEQLKDLIRATKKQYGQIMEQSMIEYMTNVGLLPNYAFPETGVKLQASVYGSHEKEDKDSNRVEPKSFELVRPASQGIKELAPGNNFYTQKFKLKISGISTFDWKDSLTEMRFCAKCDCVALKGESGFDSATCPKCNDPSWGVNKHDILKYTNSRSIMYRNDAVMDDSRDEREKENYIVKRHYRFHHHGVTTSYAMRSVGFGIEFCNNMDLYEINYGMQMQSGVKLEVDNDNMVPQNGFVTCKYCGKSTHLLSVPKSPEEYHYKFCNHRSVPFAQDIKGEVFKTLYLYRHIQTEAIKILLPVQIMDAQPAIEMFKAGINLGLKAYYKSIPEHIRIDSYSEMNLETMSKDHYLVMYDTIPGGTGYLAKLYDTTEFTKLLHDAYDRIHECECQWEGKDGCYHCILTYGNQYSRDSFSREYAESIFEQLITHEKSWEMVSGSIGTISQSGVAEDSELELKFVNALKVIARDNNWKFEKVPDVNTYRYELTIVDEGTDSELKYSIIPQFALGGPYGVKHYTVADFQFICMSAKIEGVVIQKPEQLPMWAIFLDGYNFHAKAPNIRFYGDVEKRYGIRESKTHKLYSWTMTWEDLQLFEGGKEDSLGLNSVTRLIELLKNPLPGHLIETVFDCIADADVFLDYGGSLYNGTITVDDSGYDKLTDDSTDEEVAAALQNGIQYNLNVKQHLLEVDNEEWTGFWRRYNLLQFFPNTHVNDEISTSSADAVPNRDEIKMFYPGLENIVDELLDNHITFSLEGDVDLTDEDGIVVASAEMLLKDQKIAINPVDSKSEEEFVCQGYKVMAATEFDIEEIK